MKSLRKAMALLLAMVMVLAMGIGVFAAPTETTITVPSTDTHEYEVYQIFTGELADGVLSNIKWGKNGTGTEGVDVDEVTLTAIEAIDGTDAEKAAALQAYANLTNPAYTVASGSSVNVPTGYYLMKDKNAVADGEEETLYIVQVVGPTTISRKAGTTDSDKTVDDKNDSAPDVAANNGTGQTSSDYDIGDDVPYHVTATISSKVEQYKKYHITLEDILEEGKFDDIKLDKSTITLGGVAIADTEDYIVTQTWANEPTKAGFKVTYEFTPKEGKTLASLANKTIAINFTAKLGENAAIGSEGNKNTLKVTYSNNPNDEDGGEEGTTPDKVVITFTYKVVVNKVDENQNALEGAQFALYKVAADYTLPTEGDAKAKGDDAANNMIEDYTAVVSGDKSDVFTFKGLDDGRYVLVETTTPAGYNTIDPQVFDVVATHGGENNEALTLDSLTGDKVSGNITLTRDTADEDALKAAIMNQSGSTLPSTGGIGTTIFYIVGGIIVAGAAILLIAKRKVNG